MREYHKSHSGLLRRRYRNLFTPTTFYSPSLKIPPSNFPSREKCIKLTVPRAEKSFYGFSEVFSFFDNELEARKPLFCGLMDENESFMRTRGNEGK